MKASCARSWTVGRSRLKAAPALRPAFKAKRGHAAPLSVPNCPRRERIGWGKDLNLRPLGEKEIMPLDTCDDRTYYS